MVSTLSFEPDQAQYEPPPIEEEPREEEPFGAEARIARQGKVPLHPAAIRFPAAVAGRVSAEVTGFPGLIFTDQELQELGELWTQCGMEASPLVQAMVATTAMIAIKMAALLAWQKAGRPGDLKQKEIEEGK